MADTRPTGQTGRRGAGRVAPEIEPLQSLEDAAERLIALPPGRRRTERLVVDEVLDRARRLSAYANARGLTSVLRTTARLRGLLAGLIESDREASDADRLTLIRLLASLKREIEAAPPAEPTDP